MVPVTNVEADLYKVLAISNIQCPLEIQMRDLGEKSTDQKRIVLK